MRLPNLEAYHRPRSMDEALLLAKSPGARVLGGGTRLVASRDPAVKSLVDVGRLGLDRLETAGREISIGATVRVQRLCDEPEPIGPAARRTSFSRMKRNQATVAGEVIAAGEDAFLATLFLAAGATLELAGGAKVPLESFHGNRPTGIVTRIAFDRPETWGFEELSTMPSATPIVLVAGARKRGKWRFSVSGGIPVPVAAESASGAAAPDAVASIYAPPDRPWATQGYAIEMARVLTRRLVERLER